MTIPFSLPLIDEDVVNEMRDPLINTGWLTSGPKVLALEKEIQRVTTAKAVVCVNSWVSGAMLMLRWFGVGPGDEVIVPAYTYCATALAALNMGARPVMVDVADDFTIDTAKIQAAVTPKTKVIIPVDIAGLPCDYDRIYKIVNEPEVKKLFKPASPNQEKLDRIMIFADAAHSIGAVYKGKPSGTAADASGFSFHSVKNVTTGEGGAVCLNLPEPVFSNEEEYKYLKVLALNGQSKSAFEKNQAGGWRYDIISQGLKANMTDICASIGLAQIRKYLPVLLPERKGIVRFYDDVFSQDDRFILPLHKTAERESSYHLYMLRIRGMSEERRDEVIKKISARGVGVNVHYSQST